MIADSDYKGLIITVPCHTFSSTKKMQCHPISITIRFCLQMHAESRKLSQKLEFEI